MNIKKKINNKVLAASLFISSIIIGFNSPKTLATKKSEPVVSEIDTIDIQSNTTTVSTNMLDINSSVITTANVQKIEGKDQDMKVTFTNLPNVTEKIFAVLVDEKTNGVSQSKFLDANNSVEFKNIVDYVDIPGIHLYKQSPTDPDFTVRRENFIASTSYLMPYIKKIPNDGLATAHKADETKYGTDVPKIKIDSTTDPQIYSLIIPKKFFSKIDNGSDVTAKNVLAAVLSFSDEDFNKTPVDVRQWVASDYNEKNNTCRFDFLLPNEVKNIQIHLYKNGLYEDKFLCKFYIHLKYFS